MNVNNTEIYDSGEYIFIWKIRIFPCYTTQYKIDQEYRSEYFISRSDQSFTRLPLSKFKRRSQEKTTRLTSRGDRDQNFPEELEPEVINAVLQTRAREQRAMKDPINYPAGETLCVANGLREFFRSARPFCKSARSG